MRDHCNRLDCLINKEGICRGLTDASGSKTCKFYKDRKKMSELEIGLYEDDKFTVGYDPTANKGEKAWKAWTNKCIRNGEEIVESWQKSADKENE